MAQRALLSVEPWPLCHCGCGGWRAGGCRRWIWQSPRLASVVYSSLWLWNPLQPMPWTWGLDTVGLEVVSGSSLGHSISCICLVLLWGCCVHFPLSPGKTRCTLSVDRHWVWRESGWEPRWRLIVGKKPAALLPWFLRGTDVPWLVPMGTGPRGCLGDTSASYLMAWGDQRATACDVSVNSKCKHTW